MHSSPNCHLPEEFVGVVRKLRLMTRFLMEDEYIALDLLMRTQLERDKRRFLSYLFLSSFCFGFVLFACQNAVYYAE